MMPRGHSFTRTRETQLRDMQRPRVQPLRTQKPKAKDYRAMVRAPVRR